MKLFIIVSQALAAGLYTAQAVHAFRSFTQLYPEQTEAWSPDNNIVILQSDDVDALAAALEARGLAVARFNEPDLGGELTAICVEPAAKRYVAKLKLAA